MEPTGREAQQLLGNSTVADFLEKHWGKRSLRVQGSQAKPPTLGITREEFLREARSMPRPMNLYFHRTDADGRVNRVLAPTSTYREEDPHQTVCAITLCSRFPELAAWAAGVKAGLGTAGAVVVNGYLSPRGDGAPWHFDDQNVFVLQVEGAKHWSYAERPAAPWWNCAVTGLGTLYHSGGPDPLEEVVDATLTPGDVLYLPPGTWHKTRAADSETPSLSVSLTCYQFCAHEIFSMALLERLREEAWCRDLPGAVGEEVPPTRLPQETEEFLARRLEELKSVVAQLRIDDLYPLWANETSRLISPLSPPPAWAGLSQHDLLTRPNETPLRLSRQGDEIVVQRLCYRVRLPLGHSPFAQRLVETAAFVAGDALGWAESLASWSDVRPVLERLVESGVLHVRRP